jgi:hypothetical protein
MSTNSSITVQTADDKFLNIYCHWDGYLEGVGKQLKDNYNTQELAELVVSVGDLSNLGCTMESGETTAYGRDRNEDDTDTQVFTSFKDVLEGNNRGYNYLWSNGQWTCNRRKY